MIKLVHTKAFEYAFMKYRQKNAKNLAFPSTSFSRKKLRSRVNALKRNEQYMEILFRFCFKYNYISVVWRVTDSGITGAGSLN